MLYQAPRGTSDILPDEQAYWRFIEQRAAESAQLYGYERIDTPAFEDTKLFSRSVGEDTDIVTKEMYTFEDRGSSSLTLRPEGTASVCRAYLEHGMHNQPQPVKLYYIASIFRYERPQAGRFRQHYQFGYEAIGDGGPALDGEVIDMAWRFFAAMRLSRLTLHLNSIGCKQCRPNYVDELKSYYVGHALELCPECQTRLKRNPLRLLDCKQAGCQKVADSAPSSVDYLCAECADHFNQLKRYLELLKLPFNVNHRLVRGLDYYTRTVFEIQPETAGSQSTLAGGGRYDDLIGEMGGRPTPAIGFAAGMERLILNLKEQGVAIPPLPKPKVFIAFLGDEAKEAAARLAAGLRGAGVGVISAMGDKSLKAQLRQANSLGVRYAVIIGEEEVRAGTVMLRDMASAEQKSVAAGELAAFLK
ncbi:MAG TPA: histidine--tRNA ligase [Dehalococcoidales bacterium]|nr:histidine--tRNA ligase [Dehalococcoidales bacterium]